MNRKQMTVTVVIGVAIVASIGGATSAQTAELSTSSGVCPALPKGSEVAALDPKDFVPHIDNPLWPMSPGNLWVYREANTRGQAQRVRVEVLERKKEIQGIDATVVHDVVSDRGELVENTFDWYAQDLCGTIWYLGENTREYENGHVVSRAGSWEAGVDGAQAGVVMPANPHVGLAYRQEYYEGEAEDAAKVLSLLEKAQVRAGHFRHVLLTKDYTPLHPRILEYKLYAPGVGPVIVVGVSGGSDREGLVRYRVS